MKLISKRTVVLVSSEPLLPGAIGPLPGTTAEAGTR